MEFYSGIKESKIMKIAGKWTELENIPNKGQGGHT